MATREQIEQISTLLQRTLPPPLFRRVNETQAGIGAVLRLLESAGEPVTPGRIAEFMDVSTARVAVLLKKMEAKGLIEKQRHAGDARVTIVRLSPLGLETVLSMKEDMYAKVGAVIDQVGMERLLEFVAIAEEVRRALPEPEFK